MAGAIVLAIVAGGVTLATCWLAGRFLPSWVEWNNEEFACDLNGDGQLEAVRLSDRKLSIFEDGQLACTSRDGWFVSDVFVGDLDSDGVQEIVCLTWKRGSYGPYRPFWVDHDSLDFSQHVFIFHYEDGSLKDDWLSSDIGMQVERASLDSHMRLHLHTHDDQDYLCEWEEWGLTYVDEDNPSMRETDYDAVSLLAVGDNIVQTGMLAEARDPATGSYDFSPLYENVTDLVSSADVAAVCQETPLVSDEADVSGEFPTYGTPSSIGDALAGAGFDVIEGATNHAGDKGAAGIEGTIAFWRNNYPDVQLIGLNTSEDECDEVSYRDVGGMRLALLDYAYGLNDASALDVTDVWRVDTLADVDRLKAQLAAARATSDATILFLHCGEEYAAAPSDDEKVLIEQLIDAGADVIICSHPHVVQRTETVTTGEGNEGLVCYSLGNFVSNQPDAQTALGEAASIVLEKPRQGASDGVRARVASCEMIPTVCHYSGGTTRVYLLKDYTNELAASHYLNSVESGSVTLDGLRDQWVGLTKHEE